MVGTATQTGFAQPITPTEALVNRFGDVFNVDGSGGALTTYNVERDEEIELLAWCLIARVDPLFLGDPGTGKTWLIELMLMCLAGDLDLFDTLVFKEMGADEILGGRSIPAMKAGKVERMMDGMLPKAHVGYLDEVMKGSPPVMNAMLDLQANRAIKVGGKKISADQLLLIIGSSNELPEREDLNAFRDRWGVTKFVQPVRTPEGKRRVMEIQHEHQAGGGKIDLSFLDKLTLAEVHQARVEAMSIDPRPVLDAMIEAQDKWMDAGFQPSQRRIGQILRLMKARAWSKGRTELTKDDILVTRHSAWNLPQHAEAAERIALEFASAFARRALEARATLEPLLNEMTDLRGQLQQVGDDEDAIDKLNEKGYAVISKIRRHNKTVKSWIDEGRASGEDVRELEKAQSEIEQAAQYAETVFV